MLFSKRRKRNTSQATPVQEHYPHPTGSEIHSSPPLPSPPPPYSSHYSQSASQIHLPVTGVGVGVGAAASTPPAPPRRPPGIPALPLRPQHTSSHSAPLIYQHPQHTHQHPLRVSQRQWSSCLDLPSVPPSPTATPANPAKVKSKRTTGARTTSSSSHYDKVADKFSDVISLIDEEAFGGESELFISVPEATEATDAADAVPGHYDEDNTNIHTLDRSLFPYRLRPKSAAAVVAAATATATGDGSSIGRQSTNVFSKVDSYLNSRLPKSLEPLRVYLPTYPILCLAARYSASAYESPSSAAERKDFVSANMHTRAKAMVIKSVAIDDKKTIVFAIRGTSMLSLHDWGINLSTQPVSPAGFLDDSGNLCHSGFLKVAKAMVGPIAARLRQLLQEEPSRSACSLLLTGHSAGGAVAALLYSHMVSSSVSSELVHLTGCFKRVHCVTFGAPPVSLLPLQKPPGGGSSDARRLRKCIFFSLMNEGDPVVRAEKAYVRSLIDLLACPDPDPRRGQQCHKCGSKNPISTSSNKSTSNLVGNVLQASMSKLDLGLNLKSSSPNSPPKANTKHSDNGNGNGNGNACPHHDQAAKKFWWDVPPGTLSNAGRLIVLRSVPIKSSSSSNSKGKTKKKSPQPLLPPPPPQQKQQQQQRTAAVSHDEAGRLVTASIVTDEQLRTVIFGDPLMHSMGLYQRRVEALAVQAVTGRLVDQ